MKANEVSKRWVIVDCTDKYVGRIASQIALILRGKNKPAYTPSMDCGDNVIAINADKLLFSGKKMTDKIYLRHTGYPGGQRIKTSKELFDTNMQDRILESAVKGMLPKNRLGRKLFTNLRVFTGNQHDMESKNPIKIDLKY